MFQVAKIDNSKLTFANGILESICDGLEFLVTELTVIELQRDNISVLFF